jgi:hypothetical protein
VPTVRQGFGPAAGWEGVITKRTTSTYKPGARSRDWLKLKLQYRAEFVVGGYTEPRRTRPYIGALLLGDGGAPTIGPELDRRHRPPMVATRRCSR